MHVVQLEHPVPDYAAWKAAFDRDPVGREASGVRSYRIFRPTGDPNFVAVDLMFDGRAEAEAFTVALEALWRTPQAASAFAGTPRIRVVDLLDDTTY